MSRLCTRTDCPGAGIEHKPLTACLVMDVNDALRAIALEILKVFRVDRVIAWLDRGQE